MPEIPTIYESLRSILRNWKKDNVDPGALAQLAIYPKPDSLLVASDKQSIIQLLTQSLRQLEQLDSQGTAILRLRFLENLTPQATAVRVNGSEADLFRKQRQALHLLAELLHAQDVRLIADRRFSFEQRLNAAVHKTLFGIDAHITRLRRLVAKVEEPWIIAIEGIGGIGKTALADALMRSLIASESWEGIAWLSAAQSKLDLQGAFRPQANSHHTVDAILLQFFDQLLPDLPRPASVSDQQSIATLTRHLRQHRCLIVIDNLETVEEMERLLPLLRQMMNPTKFILTSRKNVYAESEVGHFPVPELNGDSALRLIRREAAIRQSMHLQTASDNELLPIYELTGGNPLALHLVAGQLHVHPIATVLEDLKMARGQSIENLYTHIYASAWNLLTSDARKLLTFMPLVPHLGATIEELVSETGLERGAIRTSLDQLLVLNLLQPLLNQQRYTIHSLTRTFLLEQVIRWQTQEKP